METTQDINISSSEPPSEYSSTTETSEKFDLSDYILKNYIIIVIPSIFVGIFLIVLFILLIRRILHRDKINPKHLETYSSVNYDDDSIDEELENDDIMPIYTSCQLLVGEGYENDFAVSNSEPEYDCMSVDVTVGARESAIVDWSNRNNKSPEPSEELTQSLKVLPHDFWKR